MINTPDSNNEAARLQALHEHAILDTPSEPVFEDIISRTAALCEAPIALLSLIDDRRQWFKARIGFALPELPRTIGFDRIALRRSAPMIVPDAKADPRFSQDPLVESELHIRFYAGAQILTDEGLPIGVLSVMDYTAREFSPQHYEALIQQARQATIQLALRRKRSFADEAEAHPDSLAGSHPPVDREDEQNLLLPDVMMRFSPDGRYVYVSPFSSETMGLPPDALLGCKVGEEHVPVSFAELLKPAIERAVQYRRVEELEFPQASPNGPRTFQMRLMPEISDGEVRAILSITRESTPAVPASESAPVPPSLRSLYGLAIAETADIPGLVQGCATAIADYSSAGLVRIWLRDANNGTIVLRASAGSEVEHLSGESGSATLEAPEQAPTPEALAALVLDSEMDAPFAAKLPQTTALPIQAGDLLLGIITVRSHESLSADIHDEMLESTGVMAMALRHRQEAELLAEQSAGLAGDLRDALAALRQEAENAASLAHELRTPLSSVLGLTNLLLGTPLDAAQRELGEMTRSSARALLQMVSDTLDARTADADFDIGSAPFDIREVVEETCALLADKAQRKGLDLIVRCSPDLPVHVVGDSGRIRQILTNLVNNAIKFTRYGYILVDAASDAIAGDYAAIAIEVEDTGIGIPAARQAAVFERQVQIENALSAAEAESGSGLGLAISRKFAEEMGGTIDLRSQPGSGSVFRLTLRLPLDKSEPVTPSVGTIRDLRVLIVDGHQLQQYAVRELLRAHGVRVNLCATAGEMVEAMQAGLNAADPYQAVLLDESMGGSDSRTVIQAVRTMPVFHQARLVILTSVARGKDVERMVGEGLALALTKPVRLRPLLKSLADIAAGLPSKPAPADHSELPAESRPRTQNGALTGEHRPAVVGGTSTGAQVGSSGYETLATSARSQNPETSEESQPHAPDVPAVAAPGEPFEFAVRSSDMGTATEPRRSAVEQPAGPVEPLAPGSESSRHKVNGRHAEAAKQPDSELQALPLPPVPDLFVEPAAETGQESQEGEEPRTRTYALVVEDDTVNQRVAKMMLEKMGCIVDVASSGGEAVKLFETRVYDLVLIDCKMDDMDGYQTTATLRRMEAGERHTPIVAVTADTSAGVRQRCLNAGMDAYIGKPVHMEALKAEIEKIFRTTVDAGQPGEGSAIGEILDRPALLARVAGNTDVLRSLAKLCEAECTRLMAEIRAAISAGDRSEFLRATHKLRGNIMSMEARAAVDAVRRLELTANQGRPADAEDMLDPLQGELDRLMAAMNALSDEADATD